MGEAKRRAQALRKVFLDELGLLAAPPIESEAELCEEVLALPTVLAQHAPDEVIRWMRMKFQECHLNAATYVHLGPDDGHRVVTGWWCDSLIPRLHSVVGNPTGHLLCITPYFQSTRLWQRLKVDPRAEVGYGKELTWRGQPAPPLLRPDPERVIGLAEEARQLVLGGTSPYRLPPATLLELGFTPLPEAEPTPAEWAFYDQVQWGSPSVAAE